MTGGNLLGNHNYHRWHHFHTYTNYHEAHLENVRLRLKGEAYQDEACLLCSLYRSAPSQMHQISNWQKVLK